MMLPHQQRVERIASTLPVRSGMTSAAEDPVIEAWDRLAQRLAGQS